MTNKKNIIMLGSIMGLLGGLFYIYANTKKGANTPTIEGLTTMNGELRCPNLLIQKGAKFYLYNTNLAEVPGVNPITFNNLEDYTEFLEWQRGAGIRCPVLYVQSTYNAQGERVYKARPSVSDLQGGLPPSTPVPLPLRFTQLVDASRQDGEYNQNGYPAYDQSSYYQGSITPLDQIKNSEENMLYSDNPMDPNWGGQEYTKALVDSGYYAGNEVSINVP